MVCFHELTKTKTEMKIVILLPVTNRFDFAPRQAGQCLSETRDWLRNDPKLPSRCGGGKRPSWAMGTRRLLLVSSVRMM